MKIRIVQAGYESFTGLLGDVKFEGGVSVRDVSEQQAAYIGSMFLIGTDEEPVEGPIEPSKPVVAPEDVPPMVEGKPAEAVAEAEAEEAAPEADAGAAE